MMRCVVTVVKSRASIGNWWRASLSTVGARASARASAGRRHYASVPPDEAPVKSLSRPSNTFRFVILGADCRRYERPKSVAFSRLKSSGSQETTKARKRRPFCLDIDFL